MKNYRSCDDQEYEPEKKPEWCQNCKYYERDNWYPSEFICDNPASWECGETKDRFDTCSWYEEADEE